jgi:hypothetical protein
MTVADRIDPQHQKHDPRSLRDVTVIPADRPGVEPMTDAERQQWAPLEKSFLSGLQQSRVNAAARCIRSNCACKAVSA